MAPLCFSLFSRWLDLCFSVLFGFFLLLFRWRTKQNLDYSFLMMYAVSKGVYYVQVRLLRTKLPPPHTLSPSLAPCWSHFHSF